MNNISYSCLAVSKTFLLSTLSAVSFCKLTNKPFINPRNTILAQLLHVLPNIFIMLIQSILFYNYFLPTLTITHSTFYTIFNTLLYSTLIELNYYIYHVAVHHKYVYPLVHKQHHKHNHVYPIDTLYMSYLDQICVTFCFQLPHYVIYINELEMFIVMYIYTTANYLSHSNYIYNHHYLHHKYIYCNYCILNPVIDVLLGTNKHN